MKEKIYFIGTENDAFVVEGSVVEANMTLEKNILNINDTINSNLMRKNTLLNMPSYLVFSLSAVNESDDDIFDNVINIIDNNIKVIFIFNNEFSKDSKLVRSLHGAGAYMCYGLLTDMRAFIVSVLMGTAKEKKHNIASEREESLKAFNEEFNLPSITLKDTIQKHIAVIGGQRRIGTTTVCLQLVKYLQSISKRAAYVEHNDNQYIKKMKEFLNATEKKHYVNFKNIDFYEGDNLFVSREDDKYDFIVNDYGSIDDFNRADKISALEKDIIISVCGVKADEIGFYRKVYDLFGKNMYSFFNFVEESMREQVLSLQGDMACKTFFVEPAPDPFFLASKNINVFENILMNTKSKKSIKESKKRKFLKGDY